MINYIISEKQLNLALDNMVEFCRSGELKKVRSTNFEAELRKERGKILDELFEWVKPEEDNELDRPAKYKGDPIHPSGRLKKKIKAMRDKL